MSSSIKAPQQHKQPSRKGKKAWRKNVDLTEVQEGLETLREEIIQGGPIAEKPSEELFTLDTTGSETIQKTYNKIHKPLKADEILAQRSVIPAVDHRKRPSNSRITDGIVEPSSKRQKGNWVSKKEVQRLKQVAAQNGNNALATNIPEDGEATIDLWAESAPVEEIIVSEYIPKKKAKVAPASIRQKPIAMTADGKAPPAIPNPKAGTSYNPAFEDWDELLNEEGQKAVEAEKQRLEDERKAAELQARVDAAAQDPKLEDEETEWEGFESEQEKPEWLTKKRPQRKSVVQRNKAKRRKEAERLAKHEKRMAEKLRIAAQVEAQTLVDDSELALAEQDEAEAASSDNDVDDRVLRRRKMGNTLIPEKPLEVVLPDELQDSLRRLKPEGNLLNDRFRTLLVQGKMEARKPVLHPKKKKVKVTEKWSHKDFRIVV